MVTTLESGAVEHGAIRCVTVEDLTLEDAAILQSEMKDIPLRSVRHGVEPHHRSFSTQSLQAVPDATEVAMTTV